MKFVVEIDLEVDDLHKPEHVIQQLILVADAIRNATGCDPFSDDPVPKGAIRDIRERVDGVLFAGCVHHSNGEDDRQVAYHAVVQEPFFEHTFEGPVRSRKPAGGDWADVKGH